MRVRGQGGRDKGPLTGASTVDVSFLAVWRLEVPDRGVDGVGLF